VAILQHIVERHAQNASFLWHLRDRATGRPRFALIHLARLDERVEAHLDGLRVAEDAGWEICKAALPEGEGGEVFAAALLAIERDDLRGIAHVLDASVGDPARARGIVSALGWAPPSAARRIAAGLLAPACPPSLRCLGIAACAVNRIDPEKALDAAVRSDDPGLRRRALKAVGELGRADLLPAVEQQLDAEDEEARFRAAWSAGLLGSAKAAPVLWALAAAGGPWAERAVAMAARLTDPGAAGPCLEALASRPERLRLAIAGAGALGDPAHVPWVLRAMATPEVARVAGEAYALMTGADLDEAKLEGRPPPGFEAGPSDDPSDEDVAMDPDEDLRWPDVGAVAAHWERCRGEMSAGERYFLGRAISAGWMREVLRNGGQRRRAAAAVELVRMEPGVLFEVRAPAARQKAMVDQSGMR
jgi:uncharacterized protein (TIGR02270 family)